MRTRRHLVVGHVCIDEVPTGEPRLGGSAYFGAKAACAAGCEVTVATSCSREMATRLTAALEPAVELRVTESATDTRFRFEEVGVGPTAVESVAAPISVSQIFGSFDTIHLAPVISEIDEAVVRAANRCSPFVGLTAQGLLRKIDDGRLRLTDLRGGAWLGEVDAIVVNDREVSHLNRAIDSFEGWVFVTRGRLGAEVRRRGRVVARSSARSARSVSNFADIGAGDFFATEAFIGLASGLPVADALDRAVACASDFVRRTRP